MLHIRYINTANMSSNFEGNMTHDEAKGILMLKPLLEHLVSRNEDFDVVIQCGFEMWQMRNV